MSKELLIKGGYVVTVDPDLGDLPAGDVLVADGLIAAVGPDLEPTSAAAEVIDAAGRLVIPGMVDTHRHVWQGAIGGYTPQITGAGYGPAVLTGISLKHSPEDVYAGTMWGALQALDAGITTIADWAHNDQSPAHADADLRGLRTLGALGHAVLDLLVFFEAAVSIRLDCGEVDENVRATVIGGDETIALVRVEPLYGPLSHFCYVSFEMSLDPCTSRGSARYTRC